MKPTKNSYASRHPDKYALAKDRGFPAMAEVLRYFTTQKDAARALGYDSGGCYGNLFGPEDGPRPGQATERRARRWLEDNTQLHVATTVYPPTPQPADETPSVSAQLTEYVARTQPQQEPQAVEGTDMLLVVCPPEKMAKVTRMLGLLGCEVEAL